VLLRGINIGPRNRIAMPALREALARDGLQNVQTYVQSGNVVLSADDPPDALAQRVRDLIEKEFGLKIAVVARTRDELADVVDRDPLGDVATNPKRYQVSFLDAELEPAVVERLAGLAKPEERFVAIGREAYAWHPDGVARSKLWNELAGPRLGVTATARNWTTVTQLLAISSTL
jgi:uncharacterized protein (DUF1697 family)